MAWSESRPWLRATTFVAFSLGCSVLLTGATRAPDKPKRPPPKIWKGKGVLPLSGDLESVAKAFQEGFQTALKTGEDTLSRWEWTWSDNEGDPLKTNDWLSSPDSSAPDLRLVGISSAAAWIRTCPSNCLVLGDGGPHPTDSLRWDLWGSTSLLRNRLLGILRAGAAPRAIVLESTGPWAETVFSGLPDSLPGLMILPHDLDNTRWTDEVRQLLEKRPRTIVFWDGPVDARSLLSKRLAGPVFSTAHLWIPEGVRPEPGWTADTLYPLWQAQSNPDSAELRRWATWGKSVGKALAQASHLRLSDSLPTWKAALARVKPDSSLGTDSASWYPAEFSIPMVRDSATPTPGPAVH